MCAGEKQRELNNIFKATSTPYDRFGVHMERLVNKINENRHKFKFLPKGPQGMLYTVKPQVRDFIHVKICLNKFGVSTFEN